MLKLQVVGRDHPAWDSCWNAFYDHFFPFVFSSVHQMVNMEEADELIDAVFLRIYELRYTFDRSKLPLLSWMTCIIVDEKGGFPRNREKDICDRK